MNIKQNESATNKSKATQITEAEYIVAKKWIGWVIAFAGTALFAWNVATYDRGEDVSFDWHMMYFIVSFPIWIVGFGMVVLSKPRDERDDDLVNVEALEREAAAADASNRSRIKTKAELVQKTLDDKYHSNKMNSTRWIAFSERVHAVLARCDAAPSEMDGQK